MHGLNWRICIMVAGVLGGGAFAQRGEAAIVADSMDDVTVESVHDPWEGRGHSLSKVLKRYRDPLSNQKMPIVGTDGKELVVGEFDRPGPRWETDQQQWQRFHVSGGDAHLKISYLDVGGAGYRSVFGVYSYRADADPYAAPLTLTPLLVQNVDKPGTEALFTVPDGHYFGFYLAADGYRGRPKGMYYTENFRNSDNREGMQTDHFLAFETNVGMLLAMEDLAYEAGSGLLGDQDYQDLLVGVLSYQDGTPVNPTLVPEPATIALLSLAVVLMLTRDRRRLASLI